MQPFDALSLKTIIEEARPLLLNRKVDKVYQLGRDELILTLRGQENVANLFLSAHTLLGRVSMVDARKPRYQPPPKAKGSTAQNHGQSAFSMILRKNLTGATLVAIEFQEGERMVDFIFSCVDEVGTRSHKVLTAEIMGRHSNLIFWDKSSDKILAASHIVTEAMSRMREVAAGLRFVRPPEQGKTNIFKLSKSEFLNEFAKCTAAMSKSKIQQWLISTFAGIGKNLAEEILTSIESGEVIFKNIELMQSKAYAQTVYMRRDLSKYSLLGLLPKSEGEEQWLQFESPNAMVEAYFNELEEQERLRHFREKLKAELASGIEKLESRKAAAHEQLMKADSPEILKKSGDLILANLQVIEPGQLTLLCEDFFCVDESRPEQSIEIALDPNLSAAQNAQNYYRLFAKHKIRHAAATAAIAQANERLSKLHSQLKSVESASNIGDLTLLKEHIVEHKPDLNKPQSPETRKKSKAKLVQLKSSDGWIIYIGRNRFENDQLLSKMAQPSDVWLHVLGQGGAHVLVKVPASKQNPPLTTLKEAAEVAARMSKATSGAKVRVVYTQIRYVKKLANEKPGVVRYENEKTLEVDTSLPIPLFMRTLFPA
ncbi:MAG: NFACT RNA binding domain-containing protein [Candidatus Obscuribacterales bacterium]|nr:NFACT RNA binding domain-containing protein [Candidatus Obscuribacterales bacterium]